MRYVRLSAQDVDDAASEVVGRFGPWPDFDDVMTALHDSYYENNPVDRVARDLVHDATRQISLDIEEWV